MGYWMFAQWLSNSHSLFPSLKRENKTPQWRDQTVPFEQPRSSDPQWWVIQVLCILWRDLTWNNTTISTTSASQNAYLESIKIDWRDYKKNRKQRDKLNDTTKNQPNTEGRIIYRTPGLVFSTIISKAL